MSRARVRLITGCVLGLCGWSAGACIPSAPPGAAPSRSFAVTQLETNAAAEPLGIDDPAPRLSWRLASEERGVSQLGYRVLVASSPELLRALTPDVWDSGEVASAEPWARYDGPPLAPRTRYFWTVRVIGADERAGSWAPPSWFETALLHPTHWHGYWIAGPERRTTRLTAADGAADDAAIREAGEFCRPPQWLTSGFAAPLIPNNQGECREIRPAPMLRKAFRIDKPLARARVYTSGLAYNDLAVNGQAASTSVLDPGFTDYSRTVLYTTHDVTQLLRPGENVIATVLGSGQYDSSTRTWDWGWDQAQWRATPRLRLDLHLTYADGTEQLVISDSTWKVTVDGPTRYDSFYLGETYDARREIRGWDEPGFDASGWPAARIVGPPAGVVRAQVNEPIRVVDVRQPVRRTEPVPGVVVYHVGQNLTGWAAVRVNAPAGTPIRIFYTEKLDAEGRASTEGNDLVFGQLQTDYYVARGTGDEVWSPRFTYKGFEYVQLSGPDGAPLPAGVSVAVEEIRQVRSDLARSSTFDSGNATLNRIHRNTVWAIQNNLHSVITDTPVYEKNAWTGDAQLTVGASTLLFDTERLHDKLVQDMLDTQTEHGEVALLAPSNANYGYVGHPAYIFKPADCCGATPAWDAFWFVVPWESYQRHGKRETLAKSYPAMQRYLDHWIPQWTRRDGDGFAHTLTAGLGDWVAPEGVPTVNALSSTAYYAHFAAIAASVARVLGRADDAARYDELFRMIRTDFNARFLSPDGVYREIPEQEFVQTAQILPLAFGLVPDTLRAAVAARLADNLMSVRGGNPYVGILGARYILPVLTEAGYPDVAYTVATRTSEPSWGYWTDVAGFTALGEHWPADTRSRNHHMFGSIVQWFYEELAGMRPLTPGYGRIAFRPAIPAGLDHVSITYESVRGPIAAAWRRTAAGLEYEVTVPANATGVVHLPASDPETVTEVGGTAAVPAGAADAVRLVGAEAGRLVYEVGSGSYRFRVEGRR